MAEYLSIKDFARRAGVSTQSIYQRLQKDLSKYTKIENGRKLLSTEALLLYTDSSNETKSHASLKERETIDLLLKQVEVLQGLVNSQNEHIQQLTEALTNEQTLHAATVKQLKLLQEGKPEQAEPEAAAQPETAHGEPEPQPEGELTGFRRWWHEFWD